jgi:hypothetical protein
MSMGSVRIGEKPIVLQSRARPDLFCASVGEDFHTIQAGPGASSVGATVHHQLIAAVRGP